MFEWTLIRFLHLLAMGLFVGGQLMLATVVAPALRGQHREVMRGAAKRFGVASLAALVVLIATGIAMASEYDRWSEPELQAKLALLVLVFVLAGLHVVTPYTRVISIAVLLTSVAIVWFGVELAH
jgi:putative copper export protein